MRHYSNQFTAVQFSHLIQWQFLTRPSTYQEPFELAPPNITYIDIILTVFEQVMPWHSWTVLGALDLLRPWCMLCCHFAFGVTLGVLAYLR